MKHPQLKSIQAWWHNQRIIAELETRVAQDQTKLIKCRTELAILNTAICKNALRKTQVVEIESGEYVILIWNPDLESCRIESGSTCDFAE